MLNFKEIASISGKGGLFKVINPTRTGVILEALDGSKKKMVVGMSAKVSVLSDISIYTTDEDGAVPLEEVFKKIHAEFGADTDLTKQSDADELKSFLKFILPNYDEERVYISDIKKVVTWYNQLITLQPDFFEKGSESEDESSVDEAN
ncbi:MAG: hypothetical protein ACI8QD_000659 [Cyclobacteriaceae bacterium]|jgi:hypothetical protein